MVTAILGLLLLAIDPPPPFGQPLLYLAVLITALVTAGSGLYYLIRNYPLLSPQVRRP
jgi:hypothetical protein